MRAAVLALTLVVAASGSAAAAGKDDGADPFAPGSTAIYGVLGFGTPIGMVGAEVERMILPNLSLSAGIGWRTANGPQAAAMIHGLAGSRHFKVTIGAGISGGRYTWSEPCFDECDDAPVTKSGTVAWGNLEIGMERRLWSGFSLRTFGGYGHVIAGNLACDPPLTSCGTLYQNDGYSLIYLGFAAGYSF